MIERILGALAVLLHGQPALPEGDIRAVSAHFPEENPLKSELGRAAATEAAMGLLDDDCYGYVLLTIHKDPAGPDGEIRVTPFVEANWWPAVALTLWRMVQEVVHEP